MSTITKQFLSRAGLFVAPALLALSFVACNKEKPNSELIPIGPEPEVEVQPTDDGTSPGITIVFDEELRAGGKPSPLGFKGSGKPVEHSLKDFYKWEEIQNSSYDLKVNLTAKQNFYVEQLRYRMYDYDTPSTNIISQSHSVNEVQLLEGSQKVGETINISIPQTLDESKRYCLVLSLDGDNFKDANLDDFQPFTYSLASLKELDLRQLKKFAEDRYNYYTTLEKRSNEKFRPVFTRVYVDYYATPEAYYPVQKGRLEPDDELRYLKSYKDEVPEVLYWNTPPYTFKWNDSRSTESNTYSGLIASFHYGYTPSIWCPLLK